MTATLNHSTATGAPVLYLAFELGLGEWKLGFSVSLGTPARLRSIGGSNLDMLKREIEQAKKKFGLPEETRVVSCYEAGRDAFWLHRWLVGQGIDNVIVDSASIEVNRRQRRRKTDRLDAAKLVTMLIRHHAGEKLWGVVRVPSAEDEDRRHLHRDLEEMKAQRTQHINRIRGLLHGIGAKVAEVNTRLPQILEELRTVDDRQVPSGLHERLLREFERFQLVQRQINALERQRKRVLRDQGGQDYVQKTRKLMQLRGIGAHTAWVCVLELFGWRQIKNRRQLASLVGLTPTPYDTGNSEREQGISKAGNRRVRTLMVEIGWSWLRYQENSALTKWYRQRFGSGGKRLQKIGIVALARKLLIGLWKYLERDEVPQGAEVVDWRTKLASLGKQLPDEPLPTEELAENAVPV
jgi:transposase